VPEAISELLVKWADGDASARERLMPMVYDELRRLARNRLRGERAALTLEPTVLVHEAYLRLVDQNSVTWRNRAQFFGLAARIMRNILVDHSRQRDAAKRGRDEVRVSLSHAERLAGREPASVLALDEALKDLSAIKPLHSQIVELRFFGGLSVEETAEVLSISPSTVARHWRFARAWLARAMRSTTPESESRSR
jgi:RNA polymerase sigma factor (TIGR02999 family)